MSPHTDPRDLPTPGPQTRPAGTSPSLAPRQALVDPARPGDFNQAMMELGATLCTAQHMVGAGHAPTPPHAAHAVESPTTGGSGAPRDRRRASQELPPALAGYFRVTALAADLATPAGAAAVRRPEGVQSRPSRLAERGGAPRQVVAAAGGARGCMGGCAVCLAGMPEVVAGLAAAGGAAAKHLVPLFPLKVRALLCSAARSGVLCCALPRALACSRVLCRTL
jgi:hypothetical protein